jgi:hypothetical protein
MWKRKRWSAYSSIVQITLPVRKQRPVLTRLGPVSAEETSERGRAGCTEKSGSAAGAMSNWMRDRRKRYVVMGPQKSGITHQTVRVRAWVRVNE